MKNIDTSGFLPAKAEHLNVENDLYIIDYFRMTESLLRITGTHITSNGYLNVRLTVLESFGRRAYSPGEETWRRASVILKNGSLYKPSRATPNREAATLRNISAPVEAKPSVSSWLKPACEETTVEIEVKRLLLFSGTEKTVVFLDGGVSTHQHLVQAPEGKTWVTCTRQIGRNCPFCGGSNPAYKRVFYSVVDANFSSMATLWPMPPEVASVVRVEALKRGGNLAGWKFVVRNPKDYPNAPTMWLKCLGRANINEYSHCQPLNYEEVLKPKSDTALAFLAADSGIKVPRSPPPQRAQDPREGTMAIALRKFSSEKTCSPKPLGSLLKLKPREE